MRDGTAERAGIVGNAEVAGGDLEGALPSRPMSPALPLFALGVLPGPLLLAATDVSAWIIPLFIGAGLVLALGVTAGSRRPSPWRVMAATALASAAVVVAVTAREQLIDGGCLVWSKDITLELTKLFVELAVAIIWGAVLSLPVLPFPLLVHHGCSRVGGARPGSLCDLADRRAPWVLTLGALGWLACATLYWSEGARRVALPFEWTPWISLRVDVPLLLVGLIMLALVIALLRDLVGLWRCLDASTARGVATWAEAGGTFEQRTRDFLDLGVGEERWIRVLDGRSPYRDQRRAEVSLAGNPQMARDVLAAAVRRDLLLLLSLALWLPPYVRNLVH